LVWGHQKKKKKKTQNSRYPHFAGSDGQVKHQWPQKNSKGFAGYPKHSSRMHRKAFSDFGQNKILQPNKLLL
jgi:hypothetical protein